MQKFGEWLFFFFETQPMWLQNKMCLFHKEVWSMYYSKLAVPCQRDIDHLNTCGVDCDVVHEFVPFSFLWPHTWQQFKRGQNYFWLMVWEHSPCGSRNMERLAHIAVGQDTVNWKAACWLAFFFPLVCNLGLCIWYGSRVGLACLVSPH